jgi:uncharacterized membrane protein YbhN (UPF0104 family)
MTRFGHQRPVSELRRLLVAMSIDFVILVMTIGGLWFILPGGGSETGLWKMLFIDGIAYFALIASVNMIPAVSIPSGSYPR